MRNGQGGTARRVSWHSCSLTVPRRVLLCLKLSLGTAVRAPETAPRRVGWRRARKFPGGGLFVGF